MKWIALSASLLCLAALPVLAQQQTGAQEGIAPESHVFRVHVADGRSGAAVVGVRVQLWYDEPSGPGYAMATGPSGDALMPQPVGEPVRVLVAVSGYTDCRRSSVNAPPEGYNLASIAERGMAAENTCGGMAVRTEPGELVVYVRPSRWYEKLNKNPS